MRTNIERTLAFVTLTIATVAETVFSYKVAPDCVGGDPFWSFIARVGGFIFLGSLYVLLTMQIFSKYF